jgi:hypothetical protein
LGANTVVKTGGSREDEMFSPDEKKVSRAGNFFSTSMKQKFHLDEKIFSLRENKVLLR